MTLDEHIKKAEQDAVQAESDIDWGFGNFFIDRTEAIAYAKECRQLAEWLKELKQIRNALDMIRTKIEQGYCKAENDYDKGRNMGLHIAMQTIDKYMEGSEE